MNAENFFTELENTRPFLKMAFEGFAGSGKTFTSAIVAAGIHKMIKSDKPIVIYDTEKASKALKEFFKKKKIPVLVKESRTLKDLNTTIKLCEDGSSDILIIDSITHVWERFLQQYKQDKKAKKMKGWDRLQFQDWGIIKPKWKAEFSDVYVEAKCHIIFTGRAGYEYEDEVNEETGKREIFKSGIKMRAETETAFEPDLLILMEPVQDVIGKNKHLANQALVRKDRTDKINGKVFNNPTFTSFRPAIRELLDGVAKDNEDSETPDNFDEYRDQLDKQKKNREITLEEIEGSMVALGIGRGQKEQQFKVQILERLFQTTSWEKVKITRMELLETGNNILKDYKNRFLEYTKQCAESGDAFTFEKALNLLQKSIKEWHAFDQQFEDAK